MGYSQSNPCEGVGAQRMDDQAPLEKLRAALRDSKQPPLPTIEGRGTPSRWYVWLCLIALALAGCAAFALYQRKQVSIPAQVRLLQSDDPRRADKARKALERAGATAAQSILPLIEHQDAQVRARAAQTLANIGDIGAAETLFKAAQRGDFAAADALTVMKHPRAAEACAWACCRLADGMVEELQRRLPAGGDTPTAPWVCSRPPAKPFRPAAPDIVNWPRVLYTFHQPHGPQFYEPTEADRWYEHALEQYELYDAYIGRARLRKLCGDYAAAVNFYARALALAPDSPTPRRGKIDAERFAMLARAMEHLLGEGYRVHRVLSHPSWSQGSETYHLGVVGPFDNGLSTISIAPALALFRSRGGRLDVSALVPSFTQEEVARAAAPLRAYVGLVACHADAPAMAVVIQELLPESLERQEYVTYDVVLYRLEQGALVRTLSAPSTAMPWVGDLDNDGDVEVVAWRETSWELEEEERVPWPVVHTLVDGRYKLRTREFPSLFCAIVPLLAEREDTYPLDPKLSDYLARAYEIMGDRRPAIAAYQRAAHRYAEAASRMTKLGSLDQALRYAQLEVAARERYLWLTAEDDSPPQPERPRRVVQPQP